jgi:hypothetical protein
VSAIPPAASICFLSLIRIFTLVRVLGQHAKGSPDSVEASYKRRGLVQDYSLSGDFRRRYLSS